MLEALCDDLNTPLAISAMHELADAAMTGDRNAASGLRASGDVLGLLQLEDPDDWFHSTLAAGAATISPLAASATATNTDDSAQIEAAITERLAARKARDFARADAIRRGVGGEGHCF